MKQTETLQITSTNEGELTTVTIQGDIDLSNSGELREAINQACLGEDGRKIVAMDIRAVPFIDSAGLALIVQLRKQFAPGCVLALVIKKGSQPERVLNLGRFDSFLPIHHSLEAVRATLPGTTGS